MHTAKFIVYLQLSLTMSLFANNLSLLTPAEADAIVLAKETAKATKEVALIERLQATPAKSEVETVQANGDIQIARNIEAPARGVAARSGPAPSPNQPVQLAPNQIAVFQADAQKDYQALMLSVTEYDASISRVSWTKDGQIYTVYTNANFNYLRGVTSIQADTTDYTVFLGIGEVDTRESHAGSYEPLPELPKFHSNRSEYFLESSVAARSGSKNETKALAGFEALLAHYDDNLPELQIAYQRNQALTEAKVRYDSALSGKMFPRAIPQLGYMMPSKLTGA
jgi:hypothetical protein